MIVFKPESSGTGKASANLIWGKVTRWSQVGWKLVRKRRSGEEALVKLGQCNPDIVLLDVMMPGMDGFEVCRRIRQDPLTARLPIVMVTALFLIVIGNFLGKSHSNFFVGVRLPWTLSSDLAWEKSNRITGYGFVATGVGVVTGPPWPDTGTVGAVVTEVPPG